VTFTERAIQAFGALGQEAVAELVGGTYAEGNPLRLEDRSGETSLPVLLTVIGGCSLPDPETVTETIGRQLSSYAAVRFLEVVAARPPTRRAVYRVRVSEQRSTTGMTSRLFWLLVC